MSTTDYLMPENGVVHYKSKLMRDFAQNNVKPRKSNDRYAHFNQTYFTAGDAEQFERYREDSGKAASRSSGKSPKQPRCGDFCADINSRVHDIFSGNISRPVITDTFNYLFYKFKKGIYVKIRDGELATFLPFSNVCFVNEYSHKLLDGKQDYIKLFRHISESDGYRFNSKNVNGFVERWYANNCLLRYEYPTAENDTNIPAIRDFLNTLTTERVIPDCDFFINKRDYPVMVEGKYEPNNHIYDSKTQPLLSHAYERYAPIFSFSAADRHSDIIMPTVDDWIRVASSESRFFPRSGNDYYPFPKEVEWSKKRNSAVWRGSSTGAGVTVETNKRLKLCKIAERLMLTGSNVSVDAGITSWKRRPRKIEGVAGLQTIDVHSLNMSLVGKIPFNRHANYKYIIHVEGHVAAYRLGAELGLGSVVIIVDGEYKLWFQRFLKEGIHYIGVKQDLSNLVEKIEWLQNNDEKAKRIAEHGKLFFDTYLCKNGILDYMQNTIITLTKKMSIDQWADGLQPPVGRRQHPVITGIDVEKIKLTRDLKRSKKSTVREATFETDDGKVLRLAVKKNENADFSRECAIGTEIINNIKSNLRSGFVKTYGVSEDKKSLVTEYVPGITLLDWIQGGNFSVQGLLNTLYTVISRLKTVQEDLKFMHNDLSLGNIILRNGKCEEPVLIDFERSRGVLDSGQLIYCSIGDPSFSSTQDVWHLIMATIFHLCRLKTAKEHLSILGLLCAFVNPASKGEKNVLKWAIRFTEIEGKYSRLVYKNNQSTINLRSNTTPCAALDVLGAAMCGNHALRKQFTVCLTDIWETKARIQTQIAKINKSDVCMQMAAFLICEWETPPAMLASNIFNKSNYKGKRLVLRLRELSLQRLHFLREWSIEWMKRALYSAYRAMQGDKVLAQTIRSEYAEMANANISHFTSSDLRYLFLNQCDEIVDKYAILLEFKKIFSIINYD